MKVFVTGASGFVGFAVVQELLKAGHTVLALSRTEEAATKLRNAGAEVHRGDIYKPETIQSGAAACDAVIHTAFNHDFTKFKENCETDRQVILSIGSALAGTGKPVVITSGIGLLSFERLILESDMPPGSDIVPRAASEEAASSISKQGVDAYIVRLPPTVHGEGDHGFIPMLTHLSKEKGESAYIGEGNNCWPAVHRFDAARLYRLIVEQSPEQKVFHAVAETGIAFKEIATAIGNGLAVPVVSKAGGEADQHFGWFRYFAGMDCKASSELTRETLAWNPEHPSLMADLKAGFYWK